MKTFSVYETKTKLSQLLKMVRSGQEIIITDRGNSVAKLSPITGNGDLSQRLQQLRDKGLLERRVKGDFGALPVNRPEAVSRFLKERGE